MIMESLKKELARIDASIQAYPWEDKNAYAMFLAQVFHYVKHSSRIMSTAAAHLPQEMETMHKHLLKHTTEEMGHQFLAKQDVKALGFQIEDLPELSVTKMFYEPQYFKAIYGNPIGFYGYALALEGTAITRMPAVYGKCRGIHGETACNFLRVHVEEDENHIDSAVKLLDQLPPDAIRAIEENLTQSIDAIILMFKEMERVSAMKTDERKKAA